MMRIVQIYHPTHGRRVALVDELHLRLLKDHSLVCELATVANGTNRRLHATIDQFVSDEEIIYDAVYEGRSDWRLLPPIDHPEPSRCFVTGTGLTHQGSAANRQSMHAAAKAEPTDSAKMFQIGLAG